VRPVRCAHLVPPGDPTALAAALEAVSARDAAGNLQAVSDAVALSVR
jgi:hypothetical protein